MTWEDGNVPPCEWISFFFLTKQDAALCMMTKFMSSDAESLGSMSGSAASPVTVCDVSTFYSSGSRKRIDQWHQDRKTKLHYCTKRQKHHLAQFSRESLVASFNKKSFQNMLNRVSCLGIWLLMRSRIKWKTCEQIKLECIQNPLIRKINHEVKVLL